ncbi:T9SS type A sorting domain-containing protein [Psychroflexus aestuariivivens]|uniref:T9SS type A sorting domain-containing protein n=1 Tax=Psychroflexus aestuariivivens TaxID=1795040 RepID=UPI000FDBC574|nr:T9SS type A sorting domain-containing protein [Psychroflexus aestuariivivens]
MKKCIRRFIKAVFQKKQLSLLVFISFFSLNLVAQQQGDYRSVIGNNQSFASTSTWQIYNNGNWIAAPNPPFSGQQTNITIRNGSDVTYTTTGDGFFELLGTLTINGDFTVNINTNSNTQFAARTDRFVINSGGQFLTDFGNNPQLSVEILDEFIVNGGQFIYVDGGSNSAIYFDVYGDAFINGGLTINQSNGSLNNSGLYLRGSSPQTLGVSSQVSSLARERFFIQTGSTNQITVEYTGSIAQNSVFGSSSIIRSGFTGVQNRTTNINFTVNNSSNSGVTLSRNQTVTGILKILDGSLNLGGNALNISTGATIERSGGTLQTSPNFGTSLNLLYSQHNSQITMGNEVPSSNIINNFTISNTNGVKADRDFTINGVLDLAADNPNADIGLLELVNDYTGYAQTAYGSTNFADSTQDFNDLDSWVLTMGSSASTTGSGDVTGKIRRTGLQNNVTYDFGNENTRLIFNSVGGSAIPTAVTMLVSRGQYGEHIDNTGGIEINGTTANRSAVQRLYQIRREGGSAQSRFTVRFAYQDEDLNANPEGDLITWDHHLPYSGVTPHEHGSTNTSSSENWVELSNHSVFYLAENNDTNFTKYWMLSEKESEGDFVWIGAVNNTPSSNENWNVLSNWNGGRVPDETANVSIPDATNYAFEPTINTNSGYSQSGSTDVTAGEVRMRTLEVSNNATFNLEGASQIYLYGGPNEGGGGINFGTLDVNGTINPGQSTIYLLDDATASTATISGTTSLYNLVVSDNANLEMQSGTELEILNNFNLNNGATVDASTNPNTIIYAGTDQTVTEIGGYYSLNLSSTGTTVLSNTLDIYGDLTVNQSSGLNLSAVDLNFLGSNQNIFSDILSNLNLATVNVDNTGEVISNIDNLQVNALNLINGNLEVNALQNLILSNQLSASNGHLDGAGTIEFIGPTTIQSGLFENDLHQGNLTLNNDANFSIPDGFEVQGNLNLTEGDLPLGSQTLKLGGNITKTNGIIDATNATIDFVGVTDQNIDQLSFVNNTINRVVNSGLGGPNLSNEMNVTDLLQLNSGTFKSNGFLVLKSNSTETAFVDTVGSNASITGEVMVERYIPPQRAFRFFASPVNTSGTIRENWQEGGNNTPGLGTHITGSGGSTNGFDDTATNNPSLLIFNNSTEAYEIVTNTNINTLEVGDGYYILIRGDRTIDLTQASPPATPTVIRTKGTLYTGNFAINASNLSTEEGGNFNLIGNPYQSPVDMTGVLNASQSSNLNTNYFWVWDTGVNNKGGFVAIDLSDGSNNNVSSNADQYLQASQSVFIQTDQADPNDNLTALNFSEADKAVNQLNNEIYSNTDNSSVSKIQIDLFDANQNINDDNALDGTVIKFGDQFTNLADLTDATKFFMESEELASRAEGERFSIQSRAIPEDGEQIDLDITNYQSLNYALRIDVPEFENVDVVLKDNYSGTETLLESDSDYIHYYTIDAEGADISDRFEILFNETLSTETPNLDADVRLYPNPSHGNFTITLPDTYSEIKVTIHSALGQKLYEDAHKVENQQLKMNLEGLLKSGIYFARLKVDEKIIVKKIMIK